MANHAQMDVTRESHISGNSGVSAGDYQIHLQFPLIHPTVFESWSAVPVRVGH